MFYLFLRSCSIPLLKLFFRFRVTGREAIPKKGGTLLVSNHASYLDPILLGVAVPRPLYFFAKERLFHLNPFFTWLIHSLHAFPVNPDKLDKDALSRAIDILKKGKILVVYPEGTRSRDGKLQRGEAGAGFLAVRAGVPVIPVYLKGSYEALPPGARMIRPKSVSVHFGKALFFYPPASDEKDPHERNVGRRQIFYQAVADQMMAAIHKIKDLTES